MCEFDSANKANVHRKKANQKEIKFPKIHNLQKTFLT